MLYGVIWALSAILSQLFDAWGLTTSNLSYAPTWAQLIVAWNSVVVYALAYILSCAAGMLLAKRWTKPAPTVRSALPKGLAIGLGLAAILTIGALLIDSMRLEWPLSEPVFSVSMLSSTGLIFLGSLSDDTLTKRLILDPIRERWNAGWGILAVCLTSMLLSGSWSHPMGLVNAALMSLVSCTLYLRGGIWTSTLMRTGWTLWRTMLLADPATTYQSIYQMYSVSDEWLTGGDLGIDYGWGAAIGWIIILIILNRKQIHKIWVRLMSRRNKVEEDNPKNRQKSQKKQQGSTKSNTSHRSNKKGSVKQR